MSTTLRYGVGTISKLLKIIGLVCRISSLLKGSFAKETYNSKEPTNQSHPISVSVSQHIPSLGAHISFTKAPHPFCKPTQLFLVN